MNTREPTEETAMLPEDYLCVDPEVGEHLIRGYVAGTLTDDQRQEFERHQVFCRKCQEDLRYLTWAITQVKEHHDAIFPPVWTEETLAVTAVFDGLRHNLMEYYQELPFTEQLAAAANDTVDLEFPYQVEYQHGAMIGEFRRRAGRLFFKLVPRQRGSEPQQVILTYTSPTQPATTRRFDVQIGEDTLIGAFADFVPEETRQGMVAAMKCFQVRLNIAHETHERHEKKEDKKLRS